MTRPDALPRTAFELDIDRLAQGGDGVGRHASGKVVFVPGALPGERVRVELTEERRRFARAELRELLVASPLRRAPDCRHEDAGCGGCGLRHVADDAALRLKAHAAVAELRKLARPLELPEPTLHPAPALDAWRSRVRLQVRERRLGFFGRASHTLVEVPHCAAVTAALGRAIRALAPLIEALPGDALPVTLLVEEADNGCFVAWPRPLAPASRAALTPLLGDVLAGVRAADGESLGEPWMLEHAQAGGRALELARRPGSFGQASPAANRTLRTLVASWLAAMTPVPRRIVDLYAGSGNFALLAATCCASARVDAVELGPDALEGLEHAARLGGLTERLRIHRADLRRGLPASLRHGPAPEVVILDPPRSGAREVLAGVQALAPRALIYVSCEPTTLARDLATLAPAWRVAELHAVDMFPRTPHLELAVRLEPARRDPAHRDPARRESAQHEPASRREPADGKPASRDLADREPAGRREPASREPSR